METIKLKNVIDYDLKPLPIVGKHYHFWDDGKTSTSRHYICRCERIITPEEAKSVMIEVPNEYVDDVMDTISLYDHWHDNEMPECDWLYAEETDYFIECSCPKYDKNNLWFVRTKDGGWFSMDIQSWWQSGRLDVDDEIFNNVINYIKEHPEYYADDIIERYNKEKI